MHHYPEQGWDLGSFGLTAQPFEQRQIDVVGNYVEMYSWILQISEKGVETRVGLSTDSFRASSTGKGTEAAINRPRVVGNDLQRCGQVNSTDADIPATEFHQFGIMEVCILCSMSIGVRYVDAKIKRMSNVIANCESQTFPSFVLKPSN